MFKDELGTLKLMKAQLQVQSQAIPKFCKPRPVPFALREALEKELSRLEQLGILQKVSHSDWAAPIVVVLKEDGCLRVCRDYKVTINPVLAADKYALPKPDDLMAQLAGGQKFSIKSGLPTDLNSRKFVTINSYLGLFNIQECPLGWRPHLRCSRKLWARYCKESRTLSVIWMIH